MPRFRSLVSHLAALGAAAALLGSLPLAAQHAFNPRGSFDPRVPTPRAVLGYEVGARFTPHHKVLQYFEALARSSDRVRLDTLGRTYEGREVLLLVVSSPANMSRLDAIRRDAEALAATDRTPAAEADALVGRLPAIAWLGYTVHGNEASGTEAALATAYQLAAGTDAATRLLLDSVVTLIDPIQNPDGHERHAQDVLRARSAWGVPSTPGALAQQGSWPGARTSHYHFDLNRDWFIQSHPETRARVGGFFTWWPHVAVDLHEMGSNSTYFFAPPMEPVNKNVAPQVLDWWNRYAAANAAAFDAQGLPYFRREGYDEFWPGYGVSWPSLLGAVGMTYEQASSGAGAIRRSDGTVLTLHDAARNHYTTSIATLRTTAEQRAARLRDFVEARRLPLRTPGRGVLRTVVLERDAAGRADSLVAQLLANRIAVRHVSGPLELVNIERHGAGPVARARLAGGAYVVDLAQPQGMLAAALLEPDAPLDSTFIREELEGRRTGQPGRFYDVTAWSLPYVHRVTAYGSRAAVAGGEPITAVPAAGARPLPVARHGYAFPPGRDASVRLLAGLLDAGVRVVYAQKAFRVGGAAFPQGAFIARLAGNDTSLHATVNRLATATGADVTALMTAAVDEGTDLGSNSVIPVPAPRVALLGGAPVNGNAYGFAWYQFDERLGYPVTGIGAASVAGGILADFDVLVIPSAGGLDGALGATGLEELQRWVRRGGVLVTLENATSWLASERSGLSRFRPAPAVRDSGAAGAVVVSTNNPGAIVRALADTLSPLLAGVRATEWLVPLQGDRAFAAPRDLRPGELVLRYAPRERLRVAGYLWPETPARLAGTPALWTERVGSGRVIAFAHDPNYRDLWRGHLALFANAVFLGGSF